MSKAVADLFWNQHYSDYVLAAGIGAALPILRAALDAVVFKVGMPPAPPLQIGGPAPGHLSLRGSMPGLRLRTDHALAVSHVCSVVLAVATIKARAL